MELEFSLSKQCLVSFHFKLSCERKVWAGQKKRARKKRGQHCCVNTLIKATKNLNEISGTFCLLSFFASLNSCDWSMSFVEGRENPCTNTTQTARSKDRCDNREHGAMWYVSLWAAVTGGRSTNIWPINYLTLPFDLIRGENITVFLSFSGFGDSPRKEKREIKIKNGFQRKKNLPALNHRPIIHCHSRFLL